MTSPPHHIAVFAGSIVELFCIGLFVVGLLTVAMALSVVL